MDLNKYDVVIVGAGFAGSTIARILADANKKVLVIEKRSHVGGNVYDYFTNDKLLIQKYGPHIFHTGSKEIWNFVNRFSDFFPFKHRVLGLIKNKLVPIPFNFKSIDILFDKKKAKLFKKVLKNEFPKKEKIGIYDILSHKNKLLKELGAFVYENVFYHYTCKQWNFTPDKLGKFILKRIPIILGYGDTYFYDEYQYMPTNGFTPLFKKMLNHKNIDIRLRTNAKHLIRLKNNKIFIGNSIFKGVMVYTGPLDELFDYKYGILPYRSLRFRLDFIKKDLAQPVATINYPVSEKYTRITEYKHFIPKSVRVKNKTVIAKEYPQAYGVNQKKSPYYPINNTENDGLYLKYKALAEQCKITLCGRLAEYRYYTMEATINSAMTIAKSILKTL